MRIDLNADLGESSGESPSEDDLAILRVVSSVSLASGSHAGSLTLLGETIRAARSLGVAVGAHPSFEDREHFGRREVLMPPAEVEALVARQLEVVAVAAASAGVRLRHVKPHGALYNMAFKNLSILEAVAEVTARLDKSLILVAMAGPTRDRVEAIGSKYGIKIAFEFFADRAYNPDGSLVSRREPGALIHDQEKAAERVLKLVKEGKVIAKDGTAIPLAADTICVHGDNPAAVMLAKKLRETLAGAGIEVAPVGTFI